MSKFGIVEFGIVELKNKVNGTVVHNVLVNNRLRLQGVTHDTALAEVESLVSPNDEVIEVYESSGRKISISGQRFLDDQAKDRTFFGIDKNQKG
jgi:hypothetical protein